MRIPHFSARSEDVLGSLHLYSRLRYPSLLLNFSYRSVIAYCHWPSHLRCHVSFPAEP